MRKNRTISIFLKTSKSVFIFLIGLLLVAAPSFLVAQEKSTPPEITQVTITTSGRADYRYFTLENPPRLVIHFESLNVFNDLFEDQQEFPEGILVSIEAQYYPKPKGLPLGKAEGQTRTPLQGLILTLRSPTTYQVIEEENAIEVMLKDTSLVANEEGIPTELAITRVVSGPKDLSEEQRALIDTFALVKSRQIATQRWTKQQTQIPQVSDQRSPSENGRTEGRWWILAGLLSVMGLVSGWLYWRNRVPVLTVKKKKEILFEEKLSGAYSKIEQTQTEFSTERAEKEKIFKEHREFPRIQLKKNRVLIRVQDSSQDTQPFFNSAVLNLSTGGLCTKGQTHWKFPQQSQFRLFFFGNPYPIHGIARKIWERKQTPRQTLVGIAFDSISQADRSRICQYVDGEK